MDDFSSVSAPISHRVELYTDLFLIQGLVIGPFKRVTDLLNRGEIDFIGVNEATITPLGQQPSQNVLDKPVMVGRNRLHFAVEVPADPRPRPQGPAQSGDLLGREAFVRKAAFPCYAITGAFVIHGNCHLLHDGTLENLLRGVDLFVPITRATIYMMAHPNTPWQRDVVIVNRRMLTAMYLT